MPESYLKREGGAARPSFARAFRILARTDEALKGSRRPAEVILEHALLQLCDRRFETALPL